VEEVYSAWTQAQAAMGAPAVSSPTSANLAAADTGGLFSDDEDDDSLANTARERCDAPPRRLRCPA
jgi:hypothetical protein